MSNYPNNRYTGRKPWMNYDWLFEEYVTKDRSTQEIAEEFGCKQNTIQSWLFKFGIKKKINTHNIHRDKIYQQYEWLYDNHIVKRKSVSELARECGVSSDTIVYNLKRVGVDHWVTKTKTSLNDLEEHFSAILSRYMSGESLRLLGIEYGTSDATIKKFLIFHGIKTRSIEEARSLYYKRETNVDLLNDSDWLRRAKEDYRLTNMQIADIIGCDQKSIHRRLEKYHLIKRPRGVKDIYIDDKTSRSLIYKVRQKIYNGLAAKILRRDGFKCVNCGSQDRLQVHHKIRLITIIEDILSENQQYDVRNPVDKLKLYQIIINDSRFLDEGNMLTLCYDCHKRIHSVDNELISSQASSEEGSETIERIAMEKSHGE